MFYQVPWDQLNKDNLGTTWLFGKNAEGVWCVSLINNDFKQERYIIPDALCEIIEMIQRWARNEVKKEILEDELS
jgi:hypothetical protein